MVDGTVDTSWCSTLSRRSQTAQIAHTTVRPSHMSIRPHAGMADDSCRPETT
jgi:hypothetical protein